MEYKTLMAFGKLKTHFPQTKIDGIENIWIMKPCFSSRGKGVHCFKTFKEAFTGGKKMQARVIQKYIENPFLLLLPNSEGHLEKRKFDIRQWVLVTSFEPLVVYMFNSCYLKICGSQFSLEDIKDKYKHLSNYSVQKNNSKVNNVKQNLIMNLDQFIKHLKEHHNISITWETNLFPKLAKIVKDTMQSGCDVIEHRANSFELYGFDFVLDNKLNPWLIEVNLSPACSERTKWLSQMLSNFIVNI